MAPTSFASALSHLLLHPCCNTSDISPRSSAVGRNNRAALHVQQTVYDQYERRLFLRPIMPPTTRRQSRLGSVEEAVEVRQGLIAPVDPHERGDVKMDEVEVMEEEMERREATGEEPILETEDGDEDDAYEREMIEALNRSDDDAEEAHNDTTEEEADEESTVADEDEDSAPSISSRDHDSGLEEIRNDTSTTTNAALTSIPAVAPGTNPFNDGAYPRADAWGVEPRPPTAPTTTLVQNSYATDFQTPRQSYRMLYKCAGFGEKGCEAEFELTDKDELRCVVCRGRGVLKVRTKRMVQFEAR
ncbi:hypothetical protein CC80DRAFT_592734 [Byssothecium circinans]|uniref:Uncharacterized protein n=1 Tax=Byssothecium circinans TaxID=147558 RepID=A0A6A5U3C2_9PLEO|nr:hypothetical protein CC80DRAFT_592734 [Byssothecium circinans]